MMDLINKESLIKDFDHQIRAIKNFIKHADNFVKDFDSRLDTIQMDLVDDDKALISFYKDFKKKSEVHIKQIRHFDKKFTESVKNKRKEVLRQYDKFLEASGILEIDAKLKRMVSVITDWDKRFLKMRRDAKYEYSQYILKKILKEEGLELSAESVLELSQNPILSNLGSTKKDIEDAVYRQIMTETDRREAEKQKEQQLALERKIKQDAVEFWEMYLEDKPVKISQIMPMIEAGGSKEDIKKYIDVQTRRKRACEKDVRVCALYFRDDDKFLGAIKEWEKWCKEKKYKYCMYNATSNLIFDEGKINEY